jgi:hypothetical protein
MKCDRMDVLASTRKQKEENIPQFGEFTSLLRMRDVNGSSRGRTYRNQTNLNSSGEAIQLTKSEDASVTTDIHSMESKVMWPK